MKKTIVILVLFLSLLSCKSKHVASNTIAIANASAKEIADEYSKQAALDFKTLHIKGSTKHGFISPALDIRIKKDEMILVSVRIPIGGTVIKACATPEYISYYNKLEGEYYYGSYALLSDFLGIELDFKQVQNLLLGRTFNDLTREKLLSEIENNLYKLSSTKINLNSAYFFDPINFRLVKQFIEQKQHNRSGSVTYADFKTQNNTTLPYSITIHSSSSDKKNEFKVNYKSIDFDTEISFPYQIPDGYKEVEIN